MTDHTAEPLRVMIVDSSELLRRGIRDVLTRDRRYRFSVVADVARPEEALHRYAELMPDVTFLEAGQDGAGVERGLACAHRLLATEPEARIIALVERDDVDLVLAAIQAGARGVLLRDAPATALLEAAHDVLEGGAALDLRLAGVLFDHLAVGRTETGANEPSLDPALLAALSPREQQVLRALALGYRNKEIAAELNVSVGTVKTHLRHIFRKMKVADRTSAVLVALHARGSRAA